ncbi:MAG: AAA family ATPase [Tepidisphaerales bacterium]
MYQELHSDKTALHGTWRFLDRQASRWNNGIANSKKASFMEIIGRIFHVPRESFFLFGPRGTGKSTWLRETFPEAIYVDLLDQEALRAYLARPERLGDVVGGQPHTRTVIIDEVQKVPALREETHRHIELNRKRP